MLFYDEDISNPNSTMNVVIEGSETPFFTCTFDKNFGYSINHTWTAGSNRSFSNLMSGIFNNLKTYSGALGSLSKGVTRLFGEDSTLSKIVDAASEASNYGLVTFQDKYVYFDGTDIDFPDLTLTSLYYHTIKESVLDQLKKMHLYVIGEKIPPPGVLDKLFYFQKPPHGYRLAIDLNGGDIEGTVKVYIGKMFVIRKLVVESFSAEISSHRVKYKNQTLDAPLWAKLTLRLKPALKYQREDLNGFLKI